MCCSFILMYENVDEFIRNGLYLFLLPFRRRKLVFRNEIKGIEKERVCVKVTMTNKICEIQFHLGIPK